MGLVSCLIVEEIDGYRKVTFWVKGFQIHLIGTLAERALLCRGNLSFVSYCTIFAYLVPDEAVFASFFSYQKTPDMAACALWAR
jgi:hypothetical protein